VEVLWIVLGVFFLMRAARPLATLRVALRLRVSTRGERRFSDPPPDLKPLLDHAARMLAQHGLEPVGAFQEDLRGDGIWRWQLLLVDEAGAAWVTVLPTGNRFRPYALTLTSLLEGDRLLTTTWGLPALLPSTERITRKVVDSPTFDEAVLAHAEAARNAPLVTFPVDDADEPRRRML